MGLNFDLKQQQLGKYQGGYEVGIDFLHSKVHEGKLFFLSKIFRAVANNATVYVRHKSGANVFLHSEISANSTGQWKMTSYSGTTYSANGISIPIINRRSDSTYIPETQFWDTPTITLLGTPRLNVLFGSGNSPSRVSSGEMVERLETVFAPNADVLIGYTNESGQAQDLTVVLNCYETFGL